MAQFVNMRKVDLMNGEPAVFSLRQLYYADENANRIGAIVLMNGESFPLSGTCSGTAIRADGATVPMTGTVEGNQAYITLNADCYAVEGDIQIFVKLTTGDVTATLVAARGTVRLTETGAVIDPGEIIPSVSALITAINDAVASIPADYSDLLAAIAPAYTDLTFPVTAGTWCWYNGSLHQATVDIPASESWTAEHWKIVPLSNALAGDIADLKSATNFSVYDLNPLQTLNEDLYKIEDMTWEQGGFNTSGDTGSDVWIRTGLLLGGFLYHNNGGTNRVTVARYIDATGVLKDYMYTDNTDEWVWVPYENGYHVRFRQRKSANTTAITPGENAVTVYRALDIIAKATDVATLENDLNAAKDDITALQGNVSAMQAVHAQEADNGLTKVNGHYIDYKNGNIVGDNPVFNYVECSVAPGMIVYYNAVKLEPLDRRGLAFYDADGVFIPDSGFQMLTTPQRIVVPDNACFIKASVYADSENAVVFSGYNNAIDNTNERITETNERITEIENTKYGYFRNYTDITYSLQWQHKTYDENGALADSDYNIMAEIPNVGNVEVKMNRPDIKFRIYVSRIDNSATATMLQDWSHYFYRYTPDATGHLHYYVVVALESGGATTSNAYTAGRRGIKVYTYEDSGAIVKCPATLYGKRIAVMGDSIVQGRVRKNGADATNTVHSKPWSYMIAESCGTEPADYGIGGAQVYGTDWLSLYTNRDKISGYDVVFVCAGTNDFGAEVSETDFKTAYAAVLTALKANNTKVIAVTPTSRQTNSPNQDGVYLSAYAQYVKDVAAAENVAVIDLFALTESNAVFRANMPDGLHPNEIGQKIIAELVLNNLPD